FRERRRSTIKVPAPIAVKSVVAAIAAPNAIPDAPDAAPAPEPTANPAAPVTIATAPATSHSVRGATLSTCLLEKFDNSDACRRTDRIRLAEALNSLCADCNST